MYIVECGHYNKDTKLASCVLCRCGGQAFLRAYCYLAGQEQVCSAGQNIPGMCVQYVCARNLSSIHVMKTVIILLRGPVARGVRRIRSAP